MRSTLAITKALADENRLRALYALKDGELCVCQLIRLLELAPSTVSKHMAILKNARLVDHRKQSRWIHYRLADEDPSDEVKAALAWISQALSKSPVVQRDAIRLKEILRIDPSTLCKPDCCEL